MIDCPDTPEERKKEQIDKYHAKKKRNKFVRVKSVRSNEDGAVADVEEGRYRVVVEDMVPMVALGDYGADECALSAERFGRVCGITTHVPTTRKRGGFEVRERSLVGYPREGITVRKGLEKREGSRGQ